MTRSTHPSLAALFPKGIPTSLEDAGLYVNRELSLLEFNRRVLEQARDPKVPLLERLRFLSICSLNMDEFFEVRVAGLYQQVELDVIASGPDQLSPQETLQRVRKRAHGLVKEQYRLLTRTLLPQLEDEGVHLLFREAWSEAIRKWARAYFRSDVLPVLTPVGLDPAHPFPMLLNKSLNFVVALDGPDAFGRSSRVAVVQAPRLLPRLIALPKKVAGEGWPFVTLSGVIHANVGELFPGMTVTGCFPFRVTRDSDLWVDEEEVDDLLRAIKGELRQRNYGQAVRLEVNKSCPPDMCAFLLQQFDLDEEALYRANGPVNLHRIAVLYDLVDRPDLKYQPYMPAVHESTNQPYAALRKRNVLLHHPFQSLAPVVDLLNTAARDPLVLAIKITLYRTGSTSPLTEALLEAARNGKEVTAVVELRARFDEEANIDIATRLQQAGVKVVYGIVGYKAHAKMLLIVRREASGMRRYVHLGTGNYHLRTSRQYTDFGLLSADEALGEDVHNVFQQLTGLGSVGQLKQLVQSPFQLHERLVELIDQEARLAERGRPALIRAKLNSLSERRVIQALYRASQKGVPIELIVRGICGLRPGIPGISDTIRVRSIVGRFLEHTRLWSFGADGQDITYCASADWMPRNLFHRVEVAFPVVDPDLKRRLLEEGLELYLQDNTQAWEMQPDGSYVRLRPGRQPAFSAQEELLRRYS